MTIRHIIGESVAARAHDLIGLGAGGRSGAERVANRILHSKDGALPVVIQGGFTSDSYWYETTRRMLQAKGLDVYVTRLPWHGVAPIERDAASLRKVVAKALADTGEEQVNIVGHSKGGLSARYYMQALDGLERVQNLVTLGTPHHGHKPFGAVTAARIGGSLPGLTAGRQLLWDSDFVRALNDDFASFLHRVSERNPSFRLTSVSASLKGKASDGLVRWESSVLPESERVRNVFVREGHTSHLDLAHRNRSVLDLLGDTFGSPAAAAAPGR